MPPKASEPGDRVLTLSHKEFLESQNEVVSAINQHCTVAQGIISAFSMSVANMHNTLLRTRASIKSVMVGNGVDESVATLQSYPALMELITKDPSSLASLMSVPQVGSNAMVVETAAEKRKRRKRDAKPKDPNAPKRPQTAFFLYLDENRDAVKREMGDKVSPGDVALEQRQRWRDLPDEERESYKARYRTSFESYRAEMADYMARGGLVSEADLQLAADEVAAALGEDEESDDSDASSVSSEDEPPPPPPPAKKGKKMTAAAAAAAAKKEDISSKIDPRLQSPVANSKPAPAAAKSSPEKKPRGRAPGVAAVAAAAAAAAATAAATPADEKPKAGRKQAKASSPEETKKRKAAGAAEPVAASAPEVDTTASGKKKRKSTGAELEEKKKKRKAEHGDDY